MKLYAAIVVLTIKLLSKACFWNFQNILSGKINFKINMETYYGIHSNNFGNPYLLYTNNVQTGNQKLSKKFKGKLKSITNNKDQRYEVITTQVVRRNSRGLIDKTAAQNHN